MVTPERIAEWRRLEQAATPGPWRAGAVEKYHVFCIATHANRMGFERVLLRMNEHFPHEADAAFIAAAREAVPALLTALEQAQVPMPCGHPAACISTGAEGTSYCRWCEDMGRAQAELEQSRRAYLDVADAVCSESTGPEDVAAQALATRRELERARKERDQWQRAAQATEAARREVEQAEAAYLADLSIYGAENERISNTLATMTKLASCYRRGIGVLMRRTRREIDEMWKSVVASSDAVLAEKRKTAEAQAQAAAMREALQYWVDHRMAACGMGDRCSAEWATARSMSEAALASDAGCALAAELEALREVAEAARGQSGDYMTAWDRLRAALARLDAVRGEGK